MNYTSKIFLLSALHIASINAMQNNRDFIPGYNKVILMNSAYLEHCRDCIPKNRCTNKKHNPDKWLQFMYHIHESEVPQTPTIEWSQYLKREYRTPQYIKMAQEWLKTVHFVIASSEVEETKTGNNYLKNRVPKYLDTIINGSNHALFSSMIKEYCHLDEPQKPEIAHKKHSPEIIPNLDTVIYQIAPDQFASTSEMIAQNDLYREHLNKCLPNNRCFDHTHDQNLWINLAYKKHNQQALKMLPIEDWSRYLKPQYCTTKHIKSAEEWSKMMYFATELSKIANIDPITAHLKKPAPEYLDSPTNETVFTFLLNNKNDKNNTDTPKDYSHQSSDIIPGFECIFECINDNQNLSLDKIIEENDFYRDHLENCLPDNICSDPRHDQKLWIKWAYGDYNKHVREMLVIKDWSKYLKPEYRTDRYINKANNWFSIMHFVTALSKIANIDPMIAHLNKSAPGYLATTMATESNQKMFNFLLNVENDDLPAQNATPEDVWDDEDDEQDTPFNFKKDQAKQYERKMLHKHARRERQIREKRENNAEYGLPNSKKINPKEQRNNYSTQSNTSQVDTNFLNNTPQQVLQKQHTNSGPMPSKANIESRNVIKTAIQGNNSSPLALQVCALVAMLNPNK